MLSTVNSGTRHDHLTCWPLHPLCALLSPTPMYRALKTLNLNLMLSKSLNLMSLIAVGEGLRLEAGRGHKVTGDGLV
jgi:hypothetical protein